MGDNEIILNQIFIFYIDLTNMSALSVRALTAIIGKQGNDHDLVTNTTRKKLQTCFVGQWMSWSCTAAD